MTKLNENKKYYLMGLKGQWYAVALEDYQVTFLQQYIKATAFNIPLRAEKIRQAKKEIIIYDFTNLDDDKLIHIFFERQKPFQEKTFNDTPKHLTEQNADFRSLQTNKEYLRMNPYFRETKKDDNIYYVMKIAKKWHAIALEYYQVKFLRQYLKNDVFKMPVNSEKLEESKHEIIKHDFINFDDIKLYNLFANLFREKNKKTS